MASTRTQSPLPGFHEYTGDAFISLVCNIYAHFKNGKTHFGLTAPDPIAIINFDNGLKGVAKKFPNKKLHIANAVLPIPEISTIIAEDRGKMKSKVEQVVDPEFVDLATKAWTMVVSNIRDACRSESIRSIMVDTTSSMWELIRLARFGKLLQIEPFHYGPVNMEFGGICAEMQDSGKNVIFLHQMRKTYSDNKWNGHYEPAQFSKLDGLIDVAGWLRHDSGEVFYLEVMECRQNPNLTGEILGPIEDPEPVFPICDFPSLAMHVMLGTTIEDWS